MKAFFIDNSPIIQTNGAFLKPMKVTDSEGKEIWMWCVSEFTDDSYDHNGVVFNPKEFATTKENLMLEV
jgi:hypothetical protein